MLRLYYFGDTGPYDARSPAYVCKDAFSRAILCQIAACAPDGADRRALSAALDADPRQVDAQLDALMRIGLLQAGQERFRLAFPAFLRCDLPMLSAFCNQHADCIAQQVSALLPDIRLILARLQNPTHADEKTLLYLLIGSDTLDGTAFDVLGEEGVLTVSKPQPGGRDYLAVGYQEEDELMALGDRLLCSNNSLRTTRYDFYSFGDSNGSRNDFYRSDRHAQGGDQAYDRQTVLREMDDLGDWIVDRLVQPRRALRHPRAHEYIDTLRRFGYIHGERLAVPVFLPQDQPLITRLANTVMGAVAPQVCKALGRAEQALAACTPYRHGVAPTDTANELWHLLFGHVMEKLAANGTVAAAPHRPGEGRYIQAFKVL